MHTSVAFLTALAVAASGCLANTYQIPRAELARLAATPPDRRGAEVRVIQELEGDSPPAAPHIYAETEIIFVPRPVIVYDTPPARPSRGGHGSSINPGGGDKDAVIAMLLAAAGLAAGLAATEGQRFDGWARLHPMHPIHLWGPWGYGIVPLAQLDAATAARASKAVVRDREGPFQRLDRAPLDRRGLTYSMLAGVAEIGSAAGATGRGPMFHVQLGYFFSQEVGLQFDWSPGWRGDDNGDVILDMRWGLELDALPLDAGKLHGGLYAGLAAGIRDEANIRSEGVFIGAGGLLQLELTTRLALTGRFGVSRDYDELETDATIGLSIY